MWFIVYLLVYVVLLVASVVSALAGLLESRADVVFIVLTGTIFLGYHIINAAPGNNPYADEFGLGPWPTAAMFTFPAVAMILGGLVLLLGYAPIFAAVGVTGILSASYICYRIEKPNWPTT